MAPQLSCNLGYWRCSFPSLLHGKYLLRILAQLGWHDTLYFFLIFYFLIRFQICHRLIFPQTSSSCCCPVILYHSSLKMCLAYGFTCVQQTNDYLNKCPNGRSDTECKNWFISNPILPRSWGLTVNSPVWEIQQNLFQRADVARSPQGRSGCRAWVCAWSSCWCVLIGKPAVL